MAVRRWALIEFADSRTARESLLSKCIGFAEFKHRAAVSAGLTSEGR